MRVALRAVLLLGILVLTAPPAPAQAPPFQSQGCRAPLLEVQNAPEVVHPGAAYTLLFAIENPNGPPVEAVRATVTTTAPAGWTAVPAQRDLTLGPMNVSVNALAITAPNRGTGEMAGNVTILVTFVCTNGDIQTSAFATGTIAVQIERFQAPWPIVLGGFALLAGGVGVLGWRRLRRGVAMSTPVAERALAPGKSAKFTFTIENRRGKPQRLRLAHEGLPAGWSLHLALVDVELEPGEEKSLWAILRAPPQVPLGGEAALLLRLSDGEGREQARLALRARVGEE